MKLKIKSMIKMLFFANIFISILTSCGNNSVSKSNSEIIVDTGYFNSRTLTPSETVDAKRLIKRGSGNLEIEGEHRFINGTRIEDGNLYIEDVLYSDIKILKNGELIMSKNSKIKSPLEIANSYAKVENDGGNLTLQGSGALISGNYSMAHNSKMKFKLKSTDTGPYLIFDGPDDIKLKGTLEVDTTDFSSYFSYFPKEVTVIKKEGIGNLQSSELELYKNEYSTTPLIARDIEKDTRYIKVTVYRNDTKKQTKTLSGHTESDLNVAENIELAFIKLDKAIDNGLKNEISEEFLKGAIQLQNMSESNFLKKIKTLSGEIYSSSQVLSFVQSQNLNRTLTARLNEIGSENFENLGNNFWASGVGSRGKLKEKGYLTGKTNLYGTQVGIDKSINSDIVLGISINKSRLNTDFGELGGNSKGNSIGLFGYGRIEYGKSIYDLMSKGNHHYIQGIVGINFIDSEVERLVLDKASKINRKDTLASLYGEYGYDFKSYSVNSFSSFTVTPYLGASFISLSRGSFEEKSKKNEKIYWGIKSDSKRYNQTGFNFGLKAKYEVKSKTDLKTNLTLNINHIKSLSDNKLDFKAKFIGLSTQDINIRGMNLPKNTTWIGLGLNTEATEHLGLQVDYNIKIERGGFSDNVVTTGINYRF